MKQCCDYITVVILLVPCLMDLTHPYLTDLGTNSSDILVPKQKILQELDHIQDETIRNITAIQLFVCPFNQLCSVKTNFTLSKNRSEAARNCCSEIPCGCDPNCVQTGSCCVDYSNGYSLIEHEYISADDEMYECVFPMYRVLFSSTKQERKWLISKCPEEESTQVTTNRWFCHLTYEILWKYGYYRYSSPVTEKRRQRSYKNMFCARCHGLKEDDVIFWNATIQGSQAIIGSYYTFEEIVDMIILHPYFNVVYIPPNGIPPQTYNCIEKECDKSGYIEYDQFVEDACLSYKSVYLDRFQNLFCAACQGINVAHDDCKDNSFIFNPQFSYIGILDFNSLDPPTRKMTDLAVTKCPHGYFWDEIMNFCREVYCDFLSKLVNNQCQLLYTKIKGYGLEVNLIFLNHPNRLLQHTLASVQELFKNVTMNLYPTINHLIAKSSLHVFERSLQFFVIPLIELEYTDHQKHFAEPKILGFGINIILHPTKEIHDFKEILEDATKMYEIENYESYYVVHMLHFLNIVSAMSNNLSSDIFDIFNEHIENLEAELKSEVHQTANITEYDESTTSQSSILFNLSDLYDVDQNSTPYIPFGFYEDMKPEDEYWNNFTTSPPMLFNDHDQLNNSVLFFAENQRENIQNNTRNFTRYFHPTVIYYPREVKLLSLVSNYIDINPHLLCTQVKFDISEISINGSQITILQSNTTLKINQVSFCVDGLLEEFCVCVETYEDAVRKYLSTNPFIKTSQIYTKVYSTEFITSVFFSLLSIGCNVVTLLTYLLLKQLRTTPGLITVTLTFHLLIFQSFYVISNSFDINRVQTLCISSGIAVHFSFLLYIFWLNISCYHMYNHFTRMGIKFFNQARFHPKKLILKYGIYVYTMSTLFIALNILVSMSSTSWNDLGYGSSTCYIKSSLMIGLSVGLPLGSVFLTNIILFSRTTYIAVKGLDMSLPRSGGIDNKQYLAAFLKLSLLTGLTWVFGFIHQWIKFKAIGYVYIILNAGQGVLIMFAFVCNSHVLKALKSKLRRH